MVNDGGWDRYSSLVKSDVFECCRGASFWRQQIHMHVDVNVCATGLSKIGAGNLDIKRETVYKLEIQQVIENC